MFRHEKAVVPCDAETFEELWGLWETVPWTPNPLNKKYNIRRKQATFGNTYNFAGQTSHQLPIGEDEWPVLVKRVLSYTRCVTDSDAYNVIHVNWYPDGSAGLEPHSDDLRKNIPGASIYSFTFLSEPGNPRGFQIYDKKTNEQVTEFMLDHGDLMVMSTDMQSTHKHGVKKSTAKKYKNLRRINLTVRAWKPSV